tara:strand:+ start:264 stop:1328 length:1065 start_codon:yes stop_codon:yes gene_type:complete
MGFTKESTILLKELYQLKILREPLIKKNIHLIELCKTIIKMYESIDETEMSIEQQPFESISPLIKKYITPSIFNKITKIKKGVLYEIKYKKHIIHLRVGGYLSRKRLRVLIKNIILMCILSGKSNNLNITLFLIDSRKLFSYSSILSHTEINTGYSNMNNIVVYRKEEFNKVIIHELIHMLNLDIKSYNKLDIAFNTFVNINKREHIKINEAYTETLSCIINCILSSYTIGEYELFTEYLNIELKFSLYQTAKILIFYKYNSADDFFRPYTDGMFRQNTSVFSYYIIKASFLLNINKFIDFLYNISRENYIELIKDSLNNKKFIYLVGIFMKHINKRNKKGILYNTLRMSIVEI